MTDLRGDELRRWVRDEPRDADERRHVLAFRALLDAPGDPFARSRFAPGHVTASAFVLAPGSSELALVFHDALERWLQPGGHVEPDDPDLLAAARREVAEELGLDELRLVGDGPIDFDVHTIPARRGEPEHEHYDVRFLLRAAGRRLEAGDGVRRAAWVAPRRLAEAGDRSMRRVIAKIVD